jgi:hypothetical protein
MSMTEEQETRLHMAAMDYRGERWPSAVQAAWAQLVVVVNGLIEEGRELPTSKPGQCPMCGEYSMSRRALDGLYGYRCGEVQELVGASHESASPALRKPEPPSLDGLSPRK